MRYAVISYSLTGNNAALAAVVADALPAQHIKITEPKPRANGTIALDMMLNRTPKVSPAPESLEDYDLLLFIGPVWMGQAASPLRAYFKHLKTHPQKFAFASISGGALSPNPRLSDDIAKRVGAKPAAFLDQHIADLLPSAPKPTSQATSDYRINDDDIKKLSDAIVTAVRQIEFA